MTTAQAADRHLSLDVIRGIAVMGIFSVNVIAMAMIEPAYFNPAAYGFDGLADRIVWAGNFVLIDGKMRSLFSILFGASMLLVIERAAAAGRSPLTAHFARMAVLLLFGLAHFYFIWWGDILSLYAVVGLGAYLFWRFETRFLLLLSIILFAWVFVPRIVSAPQWDSRYHAAHAAGATPQSVAEWKKWSSNFEPNRATVAKDMEVHRSYRAHLGHAVTERRWEPFERIADMWDETLALMLLGMAGYRSGFLTGAWSNRAYRFVAAVGVGIGLAGYAWLAARSWASGFRLPEIVTGYFSYSAPLRPVMAIGYAALLILLFRNPGWLRDRFAAVGRAAFTNYLGASLVGAAIFLSPGLGLYGRLSRAEAWLIVPLTWLIMLAWSKPWLERYRYGPLEWLWRSVARGSVQPMRNDPLRATGGR